jgi:hypothetical protein
LYGLELVFLDYATISLCLLVGRLFCHCLWVDFFLPLVYYISWMVSHLLIFNMFYLGFNDCASAELCLVVCFSFMFYYFHAKKNFIYKFFGGRPYDSTAVSNEVPFHDRTIIAETFFFEYGNILESSSFYED